MALIRLGRRGSEVQILSPRPIKTEICFQQLRPTFRSRTFHLKLISKQPVIQRIPGFLFYVANATLLCCHYNMEEMLWTGFWKQSSEEER